MFVCVWRWVWECVCTCMWMCLCGHEVIGRRQRRMTVIDWMGEMESCHLPLSTRINYIVVMQCLTRICSEQCITWEHCNLHDPRLSQPYVNNLLQSLPWKWNDTFSCICYWITSIIFVCPCGGWYLNPISNVFQNPSTFCADSPMLSGNNYDTPNGIHQVLVTQDIGIQ